MWSNRRNSYIETIHPTYTFSISILIHLGPFPVAAIFIPFNYLPVQAVMGELLTLTLNPQRL